MTPIPEEQNGCRRRAAHKRYNRQRTKEKKAQKKAMNRHGDNAHTEQDRTEQDRTAQDRAAQDRTAQEQTTRTEQTGQTEQGKQSAGDFIHQHTLSYKQSTLPIIVDAIDMSFWDAKKLLGQHPFQVYNCDGVLAKALMAVLEQENPSQMAKVERHMSGVWDQEQKIVTSGFGEFHLVCLWTLCRELDVVEMPDYELDLYDESIPEDFKDLVRRLWADLLKA